MASKRSSNESIMHVPAKATLKQIYAQARREFTAADLQKYTEIEAEPMVSGDELLAELEALSQPKAGKQKKPKKR